MKQTDSKLRVGATVRFLNSVGGGRVARISGDTVWVEDEDGFEIPTMLRECVVVESGDTFMPAYKPPTFSKGNASQPVSESKNISLGTPEQKEVGQVDSPQIAYPQASQKPYTFLPASGSVSAYLAFLPMDDKRLGGTNYEAYLINDSKYILFYTYSNRQGIRWNLRSSGYIEPDSQFFLEEFAPHDVNDLELINLQIIAFAEKPKVYQGTYSIEMKLDVRKFFKLNTYEENDFFEEGAWIEPLVEEDTVRPTHKKPNAHQIAEAMKSTNTVTPKSIDLKKPQQIEHARPDEPLVIDLHIEALLDDTTGMSNAAILSYQVDKFNEVMQSNLKYRGKKIVFIHGKGEGVLRNRLEGELKYRYAGFVYQDASFREYSYGATQVTIGELKKVKK